MSSQSGQSPADTTGIVNQTFTPIQVMEIEIGQKLPDIQPGTDVAGRRYERALVLVRLHGQPLGAVMLDLPSGPLESDALGARIWETVGTEANTHLRQDELPEGPPFAASTGADPVYPCLAARNEFLARAPFASVAIATRNRPDTMARCLNSILRMAYPDFEVIVVDNAPSSDATERFFAQHFADRPNIRYVREDRPGLASAHNRGLHEMSPRSQFVAFTDDDVVVDRFWLCELMRGVESVDNVGCVTGMIFPAELETWPQLLIEEFGGFNKGFRRQIYDLCRNRPHDRLYPYASGRFGSGANMAFRREALQRIGGFDPAIGTGTPALGGDDLAAFFRIISADYSLVYEPAAIVHHSHYRDFASLRRQIYGYGVGFTAYLTKILLDHPRLLLDVAAKVPLGMRYALSARSGKNEKKGADYPAELTRLERRGMLYGPIAYARSRAAARRYRNASFPSSPSVLLHDHDGG
jgi:GT2 family glycosyltransferase